MKVGKSIHGSPFCEIGTVNLLADVDDPEWWSDTWEKNLDDYGLAVSSICAKTAFDVNHVGRICCHLGANRFVQICVADKGHLLAVDSKDLIELCIPGSSIGSYDPISLALASLPLLLFEQTGIDVDLSRFSFFGLRRIV